MTKKKSQLSFGTEIYTSDSATRTLQKEKGGHLQLVPIPSKRVVGAESWRLIDFAVGGTERSSYPLF